MLSLAAIQSINRDIAAEAAREHRVPLVLTDEDLEALRANPRIVLPRTKIPNLGYHKPRGYREVRRLFVDKTRLGREDEPALTVEQFVRHLRAGFGYAIVEEGEFQVYIAEFEVQRRPAARVARG